MLRKLPNYDWNLECGRDGNGLENILGCYGWDSDTSDCSQRIFALSELPGGIARDLEGWKDDYDPDSIYPPIVVEFFGGRYNVIDGNHRIILFREWGFTHVPAWFVREKQENSHAAA